MVGGSDSAVPSALPPCQQQLLPYQSLPRCWLFAPWAARLSNCRNAGIDWDTAPPIDRTGETETPHHRPFLHSPSRENWPIIQGSWDQYPVLGDQNLTPISATKVTVRVKLLPSPAVCRGLPGYVGRTSVSRVDLPSNEERGPRILRGPRPQARTGASMTQGAGSPGTLHGSIFIHGTCLLDGERWPGTHIALSAPTQGRRGWLWVEAPLRNSGDVFIFLGFYMQYKVIKACLRYSPFVWHC